MVAGAMTTVGALRHSLANGAISLRDAFVEHVYTGPIRAASRRVGIDSRLRAIDERVARRFPAPNVTIGANGTTCTFYNGSVEEYKWFKNYPETDDDMPVLDEIVANLRLDDDFWDVGANIGIYTCMASKVIETGSIVAIEPHPDNAERIERNLALNGGRGEVYRLALDSETRELEFHSATSDVAGSFGSAHYSEYGGETMAVEAVSGDEFRAREGIPRPDVVKIDVEGAEYDVLRGLEGTLSSGECRSIYCNVCSEMNNDVADDAIYALLEEYGYDVERIWEWPDGQGHYVRAEK